MFVTGGFHSHFGVSSYNVLHIRGGVITSCVRSTSLDARAVVAADNARPVET